MSLASYLRAAPKVELHVHLEGAIRPATLLELARRNRVDLPADTVDGLRQWFVYRDFKHFIEIFVAATSCLCTAEDYELIVYEFGAEMARQNVRYAEVTFSPSTHVWMGRPWEMVFRGITRGRERAEAEFGIRIRWIFDIVRGVSDASTLMPKADFTADVAIDGKGAGVVALGLGGMEDGAPPEPFAPQFARARSAGLHSVPHAGEHAGPDSIWGAIRSLGAERIAHGVRAIEDPALVAYLAERRIPVDVCPTSNICLGVYPDLDAHPLRRLREAGIVVTINSDDPPLFNTTLNDEVALLAGVFGFDADTIDVILLGGVRAAFLTQEEARSLASGFQNEMQRLKAVHLGQP
ncbi:MAG: adenosine deaminase [Dehalococcoidia bacterium]